jgi:hypothetical protein
LGGDIGDESKNISVTVMNKYVSRNFGFRKSQPSRSQIEEVIDDNYFKIERKEANRGTLINSFTPDEFILDLDSVTIYSGNERTRILPLRMTPETYIIPRHINIAYADNFIRDFTLQLLSGMG